MLLASDLLEWVLFIKKLSWNLKVGSHKTMSSLKLFRLSLEKKDGEEQEGDLGIAVVPEKTELALPPMYQVLLLNDDFTPMDFVVEVLEKFFNMPEEKATRIMLMVHTQGRAVCGVFSKDVAETKALQVNEYSRKNDHPLLCKTKKAD